MATLQGRLPYHLRSFHGGISDFEDRGTAGSFKYGSGLDIRKQRDTLSCQQGLKDYIATGTITANALWTVIGDDGNVYHFCKDGKIFRTNVGGTTLLVYTEVNESGNIIGAAQWYDNVGNTYLFWATTTRLNIKRIIGTAYTNTEPWADVNTVPTGTWPKTNLTSTTWHTMRVCNGGLYIANAQYLAFVGYDMSYNNLAIQLIPGNATKTMVERGTYVIAGANRVTNIEECSVYAWDQQSLNYNDKKIMKQSGINSMIDTEVALMQVGVNGQLFSSDLRNPQPLFTYPGGGQTYPDGVTSDRGMALFGIYGNTNSNGLYSYGRLKKNAPIVPNLEYPLVCDEITSICKFGTNILIAYRTGATWGVKQLDTANKGDGVYQSLDLIAPLGTRRYPIPLGRFLNWAWVDLHCLPLPAGCGIEVWYRLDKILGTSLNANADSNGWVQANLQDQPLVYRLITAGTQNAIWAVNEKSQVFEIQIKLFHSGNTTPEVMEANIYMNFG